MKIFMFTTQSTHPLCHIAFEVFLSIEHSLKFNRMPYSLDELRGRVWDISCCDVDGGGGGSGGGGDGWWLVVGGITVKLNVGILRQIKVAINIRWDDFWHDIWVPWIH